MRSGYFAQSRLTLSGNGANRERLRRGAVAVQLVISPAAISDLVRRGWLRDSARADRHAVKDAFVRFARWALGHA